VVKQCNKCHLFKEYTLFHKNPKCLDGLDYYCKSCWADYRLQYRNKKLHESRQCNNLKRLERIKWFQNLKLNTPCADCDQVYEPYCMDYDHDPYKGKKIKSISRMVLDNTSKKVILDEIKKCQLVCLLCHNKRTSKRIYALKGNNRKYKKHHIRNIDIINNFKNKPCAQCGHQYELYNMQCDHINPANKLYNISQLKSRKLDILLAELSKCQVLCALCHRKKSIIEQQDNVYPKLRDKVIKPKLFVDLDKSIKECGMCHMIKSINFFRRNKRMIFGIDTYCKDCFNKYRREKRKVINLLK
jgi:hypothetical protein